MRLWQPARPCQIRKCRLVNNLALWLFGWMWQASRYMVWQESEGAHVLEVVRKARRGFASMSPEKQREIASKGGRAAHAKGTAHEWSAEEAREAGRKGGQVSRGGREKLPTGV